MIIRALTDEMKKNMVKDRLVGGMRVKDIKAKYDLPQRVNTLTTLTNRYIATIMRTQRAQLEKIIDETNL